ncbi:ADP-heptose--LPS heptosyltransferase RfaF [Kriegella sp. EG-1]|nr:ADP-heptose--LPS heptosyltransferase RfaF [Flavobacteriaceae bacterium EG-1]
MGDVAMAVPVLSAFFENYPDVKITFLTRKFYAPLFEQFPNVSVYEADVKGRHKGVFGLWRLFKELKGINIDAVVDIHNVLRSKILKRFFALTNITFKQIDKGRSEKKALTALNNKLSIKPLKSTHQRYVDVFASLGFYFDLSNVKPLVSPTFSNKVRELLKDDLKIKIGIAPFAAFNSKMYPIELMEEVVELLNKSNTYQIYFFGGGAQEIEKLNEFESNYKNSINCAGLLTFAEELQLISKLDLMLAMDSGNGHLASVFGVPVLTLWGITHPYAGFSPFNFGKNKALLANRSIYPLIPTSIYGNKVPRGYESVMNTISVNEIIQNIQEITGSN